MSKSLCKRSNKNHKCSIYEVIGNNVNVRLEPNTGLGNVIETLQSGTLIKRLDDIIYNDEAGSNAKFYRVLVSLDPLLEGFIAFKIAGTLDNFFVLQTISAITACATLEKDKTCDTLLPIILACCLSK